MTDSTKRSNDLFDDIHALITARLHGELTSEQLAYYDRLLASSSEARKLYLDFCKL